MTGVRQGDVVSPLLFNIVIDVMRKAFEGRRRVQNHRLRSKALVKQENLQHL
uniref:Reverse transcriptase domain-containing protein n=1 Tax=Haplochromis burtoni TaxID=8153 RepID=A0A3Q2WTC9_HAPBU